MSAGDAEGEHEAALFVGRRRELDVLRRLLEHACEGSGGVALLTGEAGIGKTRLLEELAAEARRRGVAALWGRCFEGDSAPPHAPWVEALNEAVRVADPERLRAALSEDAGLLGQLVPAVRAAPAAGVEQAPPDVPLQPTGGPADDRFRLHDAVTRLLLACADAGDGRARDANGAPARGLLLVLDDLHWADRASLELLRHVGRAVARAPLLIAGAYREEEPPPDAPLAAALAALRHDAPCQEIRLRGLSREETARCLAGLAELNQEEIAEPLVAAVHVDTAGHPFFVGEMYRHLAEDGRLVRRDGRLTADGDVRSWGVPSGVRQVVERRLARLSADARRVLGLAAAFTGGFDSAVLRAMAELDEDALLDALDEALAAHLIRATASAPGGVGGSGAPAYDFSHALVRHTLYQALSPDRRARLHLRAAQAIERVHARNLDRHVAELAARYRLAGPAADPEKATEYAVLAGEAAQGVFAYEDAAAHWRAALEVMEAQGFPAERRVALLTRLGDLTFVTGLEPSGGAEYFERAVALCAGLADERRMAALHARLGRVHSTFFGAMDIGRALDHLRAAEALQMREPEAQGLGDTLVGLATAYLWALRVSDGLTAAAQAMALAERTGDRPLWAEAACWRAWHLFGSGRLNEAITLVEEAWAVADRRDHTLGTLLATFARGTFGVALAAPREAEEACRRELATLRHSALPHQQILNTLANALVPAGRLDEARALVARLGPGRIVVALIAAYEGRWDEAESLMAAIHARMRRIGNRWDAAMSGLWLAQLFRAQERFDDAEPLAGEALRGAVDGGHLPLELRVRAELALLLVARGRASEAAPHLARCRTLLESGEEWRGLAGRVELAAGAAAAAAGTVVEAERSFAAACETFRRYGLPWDEAEALECWGCALLAAGERAAGSEHLDAAAGIYRRHGAGERWLERLGRLRTAALEGETRANDQDGAQGSSPHPPPRYPDQLSAREVEVLALVAAGRSNQEIAAALVLSVRTVERHLARIYDKLGVSGKAARAAVAAYAIDRGLAAVPAAGVPSARSED